MHHRLQLITLLTVLVMLMAALGAYAAWRETKMSYSFGIVVEPSGAGTFRLVSTHCGETVAGTNGYCGIGLENQSAGEIYVEDWTISSSRPDVAVVKHALYDPCVAYDDLTYLTFDWTPAAEANPGPVMFTILVTASEGCP